MLNGIRNPVRRATGYFRDPEYFRQLSKIALPITLQNLVAALLGMVGNMMVGQLGDSAMAASGIVGPIFFLLLVILFGVSSGSAMFTAQLWGKKDLANLHKVLGLCIALGLGISLLFFLLAELFPKQIISIFTTDSQVIVLGTRYLRLYAWSFLFFSVTSGYAAVLRSVREVKLPLVVSSSALAFNVFLSYGLIFGKMGLPAMGLQGAALSVVIARILECTILVSVTYWGKTPLAASLNELLHFNLHFIKQVFKPVLPVILNEVLWSSAVTVYTIVYARISTPAIAAMNILGTVDALALVPFFGISVATATIVGNKIGAGDKEEAYHFVGRSLGLAFLVAILVGGLVLAGKGLILTFYKVSPEVMLNANRAMIVLALCLWIRAQNIVVLMGALRSGGDTVYAFILDGMIIWILGVPLALLGGLMLHLPIYWVYLLVMSEELTKFILGLRRYFSRKWIHNLTHLSAALE